ncbi:hypothetical protein P8C59_000260 [Phyllachora maydis]|uniref:Uncharacterized protein n=1 Tax=Phyllachora maydis TaxID=1825666 RepID=A0AAD9MB02_9PEZI|nr:hypothetical protein P8C59_000260 [Phyllachora maydis]
MSAVHAVHAAVHPSSPLDSGRLGTTRDHGHPASIINIPQSRQTSPRFSGASSTTSSLLPPPLPWGPCPSAQQSSTIPELAPQGPSWPKLAAQAGPSWPKLARPLVLSSCCFVQKHLGLEHD